MKLLFFGTPDFSVPSLKALIETPGVEVGCVVTQPDRPQGRGNQLQYSPIKKLALSHHIPVVQPDSIRKMGQKFIDAIDDFGPYDIAVVIAFGQILPQVVLDLPKHGCVNVHASLLPRWRGAAPIQRAIMAGDTKTGICLMKMDAGLDTGPVFCSEPITIEEYDNFEDLHDRLSNTGAKFLAEKIKLIASGAIIPEKQSTEGVTYAEKISNEECRLDWNGEASRLYNKIRAFNPIPGAFTTLQGKRIKIFQALAVKPMHNGNYRPGQIVMVDDARLEVQCKDSILNVLELQLEGKSKMPVKEFLKGFRLKVGEQFS